MFPASFNECNVILGPPQGMSSEDVESLNVLCTRIGNGTPVVLSCWKPTQEELAEIQRTGRMWLMVMGDTMPPVILTGFKPELTGG